MKKQFIWLVSAMLLTGICTSCDSGNVIKEDPNSESSVKWDEVTAGIIRGAHTDAEKARAIYDYICENIAYDTSYSIYHIDDCWEQKRGVCQAYCELYCRLAQSAGLETKYIKGVAKSVNIGAHAWVAVRYDGGWHLIDPTWGAGSVNGDVFKKKKDHSQWYDVDPYGMIFTHYPEEYEWSFVSAKISNSAFEVLPELHEGLLTTGFDFKGMLTGLLDGTIGHLPLFQYYSDAHVQLVEIPLDGMMKEGQAYRFRIIPGDDKEWMVATNGTQGLKWTIGDDGVYSVVVVPDANCANVSLNVMTGPLSYVRYIAYQVEH